MHDIPRLNHGAKRRVIGNSLRSNSSAAPALRWHGLSDIHGMILLLIAFFAIGSMLLALIGTDLQGR